MSGRPPWSEVRAELEARGFRPSRRLGQNFLLDENMVRRIALDAGVGEGDRVLEVGPGCGFLTGELLALGAEVLAVEIDPRLCEVAQQALAPYGDRLRLLRADALDGKHRLAAEVAAHLAAWAGRPWHAVGNLPYSAASPLLVVLARLEEPPATLTALLQTEVALRAAAPPGTPDRGTLSARLEPLYGARVVRRVPAQLFWPRPKVESAVLRLELLPERPSPEELARLDTVVGALFGARRKSLRALVARRVGPEAAREILERVGADPLARPEELSPEMLRALAREPGLTAG